MTKVFIVNDKFDVLQSLSQWLTSKGCYVRTFSKSEPMFESLHESLSNVIVINANLHDEDGSELHGQIKDQFVGKIPMVLFSSVSPALNEVKNNCVPYLLIHSLSLQKMKHILN